MLGGRFCGLRRSSGLKYNKTYIKNYKSSGIALNLLKARKESNVPCRVLLYMA
jgi:hypothetical protein